jgi:excisionase family DNA binding protein
MTDILVEAIRTAVRTELAGVETRILEAVRAERETDETLSPAEFAERAGISLCSTYRHLRAGTLPSRRVGRRIMIPASALRPITDDQIAVLAAKARS